MTKVALILHITLAAAWFGQKLLVPRDVRNSVRNSETASLLVARVRRARNLGLVSGVGTLATGIWLVYLTTGFADAPIQTYVALGAVLAMFVVGAMAARPAWKQIEKAVREGDTPHAVGAAVGFGRALNLESLLWILALTMMVI